MTLIGCGPAISSSIGNDTNFKVYYLILDDRAIKRSEELVP